MNIINQHLINIPLERVLSKDETRPLLSKQMGGSPTISRLTPSMAETCNLKESRAPFY